MTLADESIDIDFSSNREYDYSQMAESFLRYRGTRFYDQDSFIEEMEKHLPSELVNKASDKLWNQKSVQKQLNINRKELKGSGKLPKGTISHKRIEQLEKKRWRTTKVKGHSTKAYKTKVTITLRNKKKLIQNRYRDSYGRFTSNP